MKLRPETILRRKLELQISLRYATELRALKARNAELTSQLAIAVQPVTGCGCRWCDVGRGVLTRCGADAAKLADSTTERTTLHPQG